jgi:hypothetical protein
MAFAVSAAPYFSPSASCLTLTPLLLSPVRPSDQFPKPFGKQAPEPPEQSDENAENKKDGLELRHPY